MDRDIVLCFEVSRYAGELDHVFETTTAGVTIQAPQVGPQHRKNVKLVTVEAFGC